jgi:rod shape-determining protein MreD
LVGGERFVVGQTLVVRAALLVAVAALLESALTPFLTFGWVGPRFVVIGVVVAATGLRGLQALLLGFFGGILTDALGGGLFGAGALGGVLTAVIASRIGATRLKGATSLIVAQTTAVAVVAYDLLGLLAPFLAGRDGPPISDYLLYGVLPDVLLNAFLAYLLGSWLLRLIATKEERWT